MYPVFNWETVAFFISTIYNQDGDIMNDENVKQLRALIENDAYEITVLANTAAFINMKMNDISWCGFYILKKEALILGAFQGKPACTYIPIGKGVCGQCAKDQKSIIVDNVHEFEGHIACDSASNSEIVIPMLIDHQLYGVLDIDSTAFHRFSANDELQLQTYCKVLCKQLKKIL